MKMQRHVKIGFDRFKYGLMKRRLLEGESEDVDDWTTGHPLLFPNILAQGAAHAPTLQIRMPLDDTHTLHFGYRTRLREPGAPPKPFEAVRESLYQQLVEREMGRQQQLWLKELRRRAFLQMRLQPSGSSP
jgi:5,5'-dehydrodivanillate O-demethylase